MELKMTTEMGHEQSGKNQGIQPYQPMPYVNDEIDLRDVFATLWRRRKFIGLGVFLIVFLAVAYAFTMPDVYRVKSLVSPGVLSREPGGEITFTNGLGNYKGQIDAGAYTTRLDKLLGDRYKDMRYSPKSLQVSIPLNSSVLLLSYDTTNQDFGKAVLQHLINLMEKEDAGIVTPFIEGLQAAIKSNKKAILDYEHEIALVSNQLSGLERTKKDVQQQIGAAIKSTEIYSASGVKSLAASAVSEDSLYKVLIYNNLVIQNRQILSDLNKQISEVNSQIDLFGTKRQSSTDLLRELQTTVDESTRAIENIKPFQEVIPVMAEKDIVGPKRTLIIAMSFVCGFFIMIFLSFTIEFFKPSE